MPIANFEPAELAEIRAETPGAQRSAYFMNAGAALMPERVVSAVESQLRRELEIGGYAAADEDQAWFDGVYESVARLIGARREEIALVENATVAWQLVFYSLAFEPGDRILTSEAEYAANCVAFLQIAQRDGVTIDVVPSDEAGQVDVDALEETIDERVRLIALTWMPSNGGLVNPAAEVGRIAERHGIFYLLDACQAVGQWPVDVGELRCDALSATGRKFLRGPRGTGFLYVKRSMLQHLHPPMIDHFSAPWTALNEYTLREDARRFETWENSYALRSGLRVAVDYALEIGIERIQQRCGLLAGRLRFGLEAIPGVSVLDLGVERSAIVSFRVHDLEAADVVSAAATAGITIGFSRPTSTLLDSTRRSLPLINRASPHYFTSEDEVDRLIEFIDGRG